MSYSLAQAAAAVGVYKSTVFRAIKAGKISANRDEHGQWHIEPAELHRVYPPGATAKSGNGAAHRDATAAASAALAEANQRATLAEHRVADLREQLDDVRRDRDEWRAQAQRLALTDQRARRSWWPWRAAA
jgi:hypothetical protein